MLNRLITLLLVASCAVYCGDDNTKKVRNSNNPSSNPQRGGTDLGGGGVNYKLTWDSNRKELLDSVKKLSHIGKKHEAEFELIQAELPKLMEELELSDKDKEASQQSVRFVNHRLFVGQSMEDVVSNDNDITCGDYLDEERDALNFMDQKVILVNKSRLNCFIESQDTDGLMALVLHEYLGLLGIERDLGHQSTFELSSLVVRYTTQTILPTDLTGYYKEENIVNISNCTELSSAVKKMNTPITENKCKENSLTTDLCKTMNSAQFLVDPILKGTADRQLFNITNSFSCENHPSINSILLTGDVEGNGHTISNLSISNKDSQVERLTKAAPVFYSICGHCTVKNIKFTDINAEAKEAGSVLAEISQGTISHIVISGKYNVTGEELLETQTSTIIGAQTSAARLMHAKVNIDHNISAEALDLAGKKLEIITSHNNKGLLHELDAAFRIPESNKSLINESELSSEFLEVKFY